MNTDFPFLNEKMNNKRIAYLDNAATSLKPLSVIQEMDRYYLKHTSNVHRGIYRISEENTTALENIRNQWKDFINAKSANEVIFTTGTTHGLNLLAFSLGELLSAGDEIVVSGLEHHANIGPWQMLALRKNLKLKVIPLNPDGTINIDEAYKLLNDKVKILSLTLASNTIGVKTPAELLFAKAQEYKIITVADGAQLAAHEQIDVQKLKCDFLVFSGHKILGPTGVGILYGKEALLEKIPPYQGGGNMIDQVKFEKTTYNVLPHKFEPGTPPIGEILGLGAALDYLKKISFAKIHEIEAKLYQSMTIKLKEIDNLNIYGPQIGRLPIFAFNIKGLHSHDIGQILDQEGICIRTGHHCTQPLMGHFNCQHMARASLSFYNTEEDIDQFIMALKKAKKMLIG